MKNRGLLCLVLICCTCIAFAGGLFLGRNYNRPPVQVYTPVPEPPESTAAQEQLDINTATLSQLQKLPGIGPAIAQRILDYRQENGPFSSVGELVNVDGIGEAKLEAILDYITVIREGE